MHIYVKKPIKMGNETIEKIDGDQIPGTPEEHIIRFEVDGYIIKAVFSSKQHAAEYVNKYSTFGYSETWYDKIGFADFSISDNIIEGSSTYHPPQIMIKMIKDGLKYL